MPIRSTDEDVHVALQRLRKNLICFNALGFLFGNGFKEVEASGLAMIDSTGTQRKFIVVAGGLPSTCRVGRPTFSFGGEPPVDPTKGMAASFIEASEVSTAAVDALQLIGQQSPTWSDLYVAYELVEANGGINITKAGWISEANLTLFKRTANSYSALGANARHGDSKQDPPRIPMTLEDATRQVRQLVGAWIKSLQTERCSEKLPHHDWAAEA